MEHQSTIASGTLMEAAFHRAEIPNLEKNNMNVSRRYLSPLFLAAALVAPVAIVAVPVPQDAKVQVRVYDKDHKDYHDWNDNENRAWGQYQTENHQKSYEFSRANNKQQSQYWNWRHSHPDKD
jgi:hypothetical protein